MRIQLPNDFMFGTIRKHQNWLWVIIITVIIISFVVFFSPYSRVNERSGGGNYGSVSGERISREEYADAQREIYLRHFFSNGGQWPDEEARRSGFDPMRETYQWLFLVQKQKDMDIHISSEQVAQFAREMVRPLERRGISTPQQFIDQVLKSQGMSAADFERFVRHYLGIQELISSLGVSGKLATPAEIESLFIRENQEIVAEAVLFTASNYLSQVNINPELLTQFFSNQVARYRIPERVQVNYVKFDLTNFTAQAEAELAKTNLTQIIEENYRRLGTNYFADAKTPEAVKAKIRSELIKSRALVFARRAAADFASPLFEMQPAKPESLEAAAKAKGLKVYTSKPFDRNEGPSEIEVGPDFAKTAFSRTEEEPFSPPVVGQDGVYVFATIKRFPSEVPTLDQVREKVTADYRYSQAMMLARQAGLNFQTQVTNAMAQGKTFDQAAADAKLKPITLPPFSLSTRALGEIEEKININQLKDLAFSTSVGKTSNFRMTAEGGLIVFVKAKQPIDQDKMKSELPTFANYVRQSRQTEAFNDWFRHEAEKALRDTPAFQPQQPEVGPSGQKAPATAPKAPAAGQKAPATPKAPAAPQKAPAPTPAK